MYKIYILFYVHIDQEICIIIRLVQATCTQIMLGNNKVAMKECVTKLIVKVTISIREGMRRLENINTNCIP